MKTNHKNFIIIGLLLLVGITATVTYRRTYQNSDQNKAYSNLPPEEFIRLIESVDQHVWLKMHNQHSQRYLNLIPEDRIQAFYLVQNGQAHVYTARPGDTLDFQLITTIKPEELIVSIEKKKLGEVALEVNANTYVFSVSKEADSVHLRISRTDGLEDAYTWDQSLPDSELVTDLFYEQYVFSGFYHEAANSDRFLKFHTLALLTPDIKQKEV